MKCILFFIFKQGRATGRLLSIIILAEGAHNVHGEPVTAGQVKNVSGGNISEICPSCLMIHRPKMILRLVNWLEMMFLTIYWNISQEISSRHCKWYNKIYENLMIKRKTEWKFGNRGKIFKAQIYRHYTTLTRQHD